MNRKTKTRYDTGYRADIDGLRGIAVLSVILYHADQQWLPGGFVGVDIFFVISGFLITRTVLSDIERGHFTLADFYRRRIKRIAPAMLVVIAATLLLAQVILLPEDAVDTAQAAIASIAGLANVYFWWFLDTGYFAADMRQVPLLHLWSLGVEEQFYLLWPLLLLFAHRRLISLPLSLLLVLAALSFLLASLLNTKAPGFTFYLLPTRAGELLVGACLAIGFNQAVASRCNQHLALLMALAGVGLLAGSVLLITEHHPFPGFIALAPVLGTALLIASGTIGLNVISHCFAAWPLRLTGLVSYSAYLWHWPILAFLRYGYGELNLSMITTALVATFVLAILSYRFIETPTRASQASAGVVFTRQFLAPASLIAIIAVLSITLGGYGLQAGDSQYAAELADQRQRMQAAYHYSYICQKRRLEADDLNNPDCMIGETETSSPRVLLWGDSNASHFVGIVGAFAQAAPFSFRNAQIQSCPPIAADPLPYVYERDLDNCRASLKLIQQHLTRFDVVIMAASWPGYAAERDDFLDHLFSFSRRLADNGTLVLLLGKAPVPDHLDRLCGAKALRFPGLNCSSKPASLTPDIVAMNQQLEQFAASESGVEYYDLTGYLCANGSCRVYSEDGQSLYFDAHHLSLAAAWEIGEDIISRDGVPEIFKRIARFH